MDHDELPEDPVGTDEAPLGGLTIAPDTLLDVDLPTGTTAIVGRESIPIVAPTMYPGVDLAGTAFTFGDLEDVDDPDAFPARMNVRLHLDFPDGPGTCSGSLIDARHLLTAAHCIKRDDNGGMITSGVATPGDGGFGSANFLQARLFSAWIDHENRNYDIAIVFLDRPIGALTGWHGYRVDSCADHTSESYTSFSYPDEDPFTGDMIFWDGSFDWCPNTHIVQANSQDDDVIHEGMSGGGMARNVDGGLMVSAVWSTGYLLPPEGSRAVRLWNHAFDEFHSFLHGHRSDAPDLMPVGLKFPVMMTPEYDATPSGVDITVHNYSEEDFSGPVSVDFFLSDDTTITASDIHLGTWTEDLDIPGMGAVKLDIPSNALEVPLEALPANGQEVRRLRVGAVLDVDDADASNNVTIVSDVLRIEIHDAESELDVVSVDATDGTYFGSDPVPVTFHVQNAGLVATGPVSGSFYLSTLDTFDASAILVGSGKAPPIPALGNYVDADVLDVSDVPSGKYFVHFVAQDDLVGHVEIAHDPVRIKIVHVNDDIAGPLGNLRVDYMGFSGESFDQSDVLPVAWSVTNTGAQNVGAWQVWIFASPVPGLSPDMVYLGGGTSPGLAGGVTRAAVSNLSLARLEAGAYHLVFVVNGTTESSRADNFWVSGATFEIELGYAFDLDGPSPGGP